MAKKTITMTKDGGRYYRAIGFFYASILVLTIPVVIILLLCLLNPFWFRESMFDAFHRNINKLTDWRNHKKYAIYLGMDPAVWHALKD